MNTINYIRDKSAAIWSKVWTWVADHPKTTVVIAGAVIIALGFGRKY